MTFASLLALGSCEESGAPKPLQINNALTEAEKAEGKFTAEIMWKMGRIGSQTLSEDGSKLVYALTEYNLAENRGVTTLWLRDMATGETKRLTDYSSSNHSAQWLDANTIAFLSNRTGSSQVWAMDVNTLAVRQVSNLEKDVEGFGITADHAFYIQRVEAAKLKGSNKYEDMDKSKVRIYDDLMVRHWDYWDDGSYLHVFAADYTNGQIVNGKDIIGADKAYDAPLAPYFDPAEIRLSPDGTKLAYTCKPLTGVEYALSTDSDIFLYDFATETTRNLSKEAANEEEKFVGYDKYPVFSPDGTKIAFRSQRRPGNEADQQRLWVFDLNTNECTYITRGQDYCVTEVPGDEGLQPDVSACGIDRQLRRRGRKRIGAFRELHRRPVALEHAVAVHPRLGPLPAGASAHAEKVLRKHVDAQALAGGGLHHKRTVLRRHGILPSSDRASGEHRTANAQHHDLFHLPGSFASSFKTLRRARYVAASVNYTTRRRCADYRDCRLFVSSLAEPGGSSLAQGIPMARMRLRCVCIRPKKSA